MTNNHLSNFQDPPFDIEEKNRFLSWHEGYHPDEHQPTKSSGSQLERLETFAHERTGTVVKINKNHGEEGETYTVQADFGGLNDREYVVQSSDPTEWVSGTSSVLAMGVRNKATARAIAFAWIQGWHWRTVTTNAIDAHLEEGDIRDFEE